MGVRQKNRSGKESLAAYFFPVFVEHSLRFCFSGDFLRGERLLNSGHDLLSLAFFMRLGMFRVVFRADSPTGQ
jgi:hypothetical protein